MEADFNRCNDFSYVILDHSFYRTIYIQSKKKKEYFKIHKNMELFVLIMYNFL